MCFARTDLVKLRCSMTDNYQSCLLFVCWGFFVAVFVCIQHISLRKTTRAWTNKGQEYFFHSPFHFQEWKNYSKLILVFLISNQHFKGKLSYVKLNKHRSKTVCNSMLLFLMCFWFGVGSRLFWFVLRCSLCFLLHWLIPLQGLCKQLLFQGLPWNSNLPFFLC